MFNIEIVGYWNACNTSTRCRSFRGDKWKSVAWPSATSAVRTTTISPAYCLVNLEWRLLIESASSPAILSSAPFAPSGPDVTPGHASTYRFASHRLHARAHNYIGSGTPTIAP